MSREISIVVPSKWIQEALVAQNLDPYQVEYVSIRGQYQRGEPVVFRCEAFFKGEVREAPESKVKK